MQRDAENLLRVYTESLNETIPLDVIIKLFRAARKGVKTPQAWLKQFKDDGCASEILKIYNDVHILHGFCDFICSMSASANEYEDGGLSVFVERIAAKLSVDERIGKLVGYIVMNDTAGLAYDLRKLNHRNHTAGVKAFFLSMQNKACSGVALSVQLTQAANAIKRGLAYQKINVTDFDEIKVCVPVLSLLQFAELIKVTDCRVTHAQPVKVVTPFNQFPPKEKRKSARDSKPRPRISKIK